MATSLTIPSDFNPVLDHIQSACLLIDRTGKIVYANQRFQSVTEFSIDELDGISLFRLSSIASEDAARIQCILADENENRGESVEIDLICKSGRKKKTMLHIEQVRLEDGIFGLILLHDLACSSRPDLPNVSTEPSTRFRNAQPDSPCVSKDRTAESNHESDSELKHEGSSPGHARILDPPTQKPTHRSEVENHLELTQREARMGSFSVLNGSNQIGYCSEECLRVLGLSSAAELASWNDFVAKISSSQSRDQAQAAFEDCQNRGKAFELECRMFGPKGTDCWILIKGLPDEDGRETRYGFRATIQDISSRKQAEQAVRASEQRFSAIFEHEPECVKLIDQDGNLLQMNPAGLALVEAKTIDQVAGKCVYSIIAPEDREFFKLENEAVFEGASRILEFDIIGLGGTRRRMESHQVPLRDETGKITANLAVTRDITQRRLAENRLRESEAFWRSLTESSTDHVVTLDRDLRIVYSNRGWDGIPAHELTGRPMQVLVEPAQQDEVFATLNRVLQTGTPANYETVFDSAENDKRYYDSRVSARIIEGQVIGLTVDTREISKSKRAEIALRNVVSGTASDTGAAFYHSITQKLAEAINVEYVCVAETIGDDQEQLRSLSFWCDGHHHADMVIEIAGSPCEILSNQTAAFYSKGVKETFPENGFLKQFDVEGFLGVKLMDSHGKQIGLLSAFSVKPLANQDEIVSLMNIFADRIACEIERTRTYQQLKESNQKLDQAHERLNLAINGTSDGLWDWDLSRKRVWISPNGMAILGDQGGERFAGAEYWESLVHPSDLYQMKLAVDEHFHQGKRFDVEVRVKTVSEEYLWIHFRGDAIRDASGKPIRMSGSMQDVTQQRRGERALKESENRMRILLGQVPAIVWSTDRQLEFTMIAGAALRKADVQHRQHPWENVLEFFEVHHRTETPLQKHEQALDGIAGSFRSEQRGRTYQNYVEPLRNEANEIIGVIGVALDITEHKLTEDSLEQSERMYRTLFDNLPVGVAISDEDGNLLDANESCIELAGVKDKAALLGRNPLNYYANPADQIRVKDRLASEGSARREELELKRFNGESYYALVSVAPLNLNHRNCLLSVLEDITTRKELEKKLQRFKYMLDRSGEAIFLLDPKTAKFIDVNPTCYEQLGYTRDELIGMNMFQVQILGDHTTSEQWANLVSLLRVKNSHSISGSHQRKDGTTFPVEITVSLSRHEGREFMLAIARDVTQRKTVERSLSESEARARSLLENHVDGVAVVSSGTILYVNEPLCSMMGRTRLEMEGQPAETLLQDWDRTQQDDCKAGSWGNQAMEHELGHQDGSRVPVEIVRRQFEFQGRESVLYVFRDITQRKKLELDARRHREMVAHVSRISTLGEMATGLAHELNQPLSAICLFSDACSAEFESPNPDFSKINQILHDLSEQSMRAGAIVDRIRKFVGKEQFRQTSCLLQSIVDDVLKLLKLSLMEKEIAVRVEIHSEADSVYVDPVQIEQVIVNLLQNSIDAIENLEDSSNGQIEISAKKISPEFLEVSIRDNGLGMSESQVEDVFNAFYTTKYHGMGMGLAICRTIIEGHQGQISVKSSPHHGTICQFTLPTPAATRHFQSNQGDDAQGRERVQT